jgi:putative CocE/NonD family hydrolase
MVIETDVRMRARDGVELAADVYRPDDDASHPVLLHRTPYDKSNPAFVSALIVDPVWLARCGYVVVVQDVRGRFASGGDYDFFVQEYDDGYDAVEWAATQPWSNGHVGIYGSSYHAMTTYQAVAARPPHLHAAAALVGAAGLSPTVRPGGCFELGFLASYLLAHSLDTISRLSVPETEKTALVGQVHAALADPMGTVAHLPIADLPVLGDGLVAPAWKTWIEQEPDSAYWQCDTLLAHPERVAIPVLHVAGVMDFLSPTMLELFEATQHDGRQRLVLGPWTHYGTYTGHVGARDYRSSAGGGPATLGPLIGSWFDRWLHDTNPAPDPAPVVRYFISGENRWHNAPSWPPATAERVYYLTSGGHANTRFGDGILGTAQPAETRSDRFRSDPLDPVPSHGGMLATPTLGPTECKTNGRSRNGPTCSSTPPGHSPRRSASPDESEWPSTCKPAFRMPTSSPNSSTSAPADTPLTSAKAPSERATATAATTTG